MSTIRDVAARIIQFWMDEARNGVAMATILLKQDEEMLVDAIDKALQAEREQCAKRAESARLPRGYQWGHDAMEQFNFGKERAAKAIREGKEPK